jgi:hypothetical protein
MAVQRVVLLSTAALVALLTGCAEMCYERVQLGQEQRAYRGIFPEESTRRSTAGVCYCEKDGFGRTDAAVLLLTGDRRVAGKLYALHQERKSGLQAETTYRLRGELDPQLLKLSATGPIDMLRAIADDLTTAGDDTFVREAHGWIAGGLVRLMQRWPHVGDEGPAFTRLTEMLERIPAGGVARIAVDPRGVYSIEYTQTVAR